MKVNQKSKNDELRCLNIVKKYKKIPEILGLIEESESPDFIINKNIGLEHFMIDIIFLKKTNKYNKTTQKSINRMQQENAIKKIELYKNNVDIYKKDLKNGNALKFLNQELNCQIDGMNNFSYESFIANFKRIYEKHLKSVETYKNNYEKIGFLIEVPFIKPIKHCYVITDSKGSRKQSLKSFPITKDMINLFKKSSIDFIIICAININYFGNKKDVQVIKIDMNNIKDSIKSQGMIICDSFTFPKYNLEIFLTQMEVQNSENHKETDKNQRNI